MLMPMHTGPPAMASSSRAAHNPVSRDPKLKHLITSRRTQHGRGKMYKRFVPETL
jgi:hypothetical protein